MTSTSEDYCTETLTLLETEMAFAPLPVVPVTMKV
jgi:hypothetical protein